MWRYYVALILVLSHSLAEKEPGGGELPAHKRQSVQYSTLVGPSFVNASLHAQTHATVGKTVYLTCIVKNLHNYTVSWVRARDIHLLTAGVTTYTSDNRFSAVNPVGGDHWMLRLRHARPSDAGTYLCQVSVSPPISVPITLTVSEAVASVRPGTDVYLKVGSKVVLICEVIGCPYPASPAWYRGYRLQGGTSVSEGHFQSQNINGLGLMPLSANLSYPLSSASTPLQSTNARLKMVPKLSFDQYSPKMLFLRSHIPKLKLSPFIEPSSSLVILPVATATLTRPKALVTHSGVYSCLSTCTSPVNLTLHVLTDDEETAAMQHPNGASGLYLLSPPPKAKIFSSIHLGTLLTAMYIHIIHGTII
ncbi:hypothetical protein SK128_014158 [Halocaridina rubra]|uniref:Ig-like domain-containing protein n=1 Tax=Halocaridina rubra TaxID=373956 RepID=A0AAN8XVW3_HALRR